MDSLPTSIILVIAVATIFLSITVALTYRIRNNFFRTRLIMTGFFSYIVFTLTASFWNYALLTLPYTIPAALVGIVVGHFVGVKTAKEKLSTQGIEHYMEHFAHIHLHEIKALHWWSFVNFYSVLGALGMINLVGLSNVIFHGSQMGAIITSIIGAFLIGSIIPYLVHLWSIRAREMR